MMSESSIPEDSTDQCSICGQEVTVDPSSPSDDARCSHCGHLSWFRKQEMKEFVILNLLPSMNPEHANFEPVGGWLVRPDNPPHVVINFANVEFVSSTFLGRLLALQKRLDGAERKLTLCALNKVVREIFQITQLERFFDFADDQEEAIQGV